MKYGMILKEQNEIDILFSLVFLTILLIFSPEVTLIRDQVLINVNVYGSPKKLRWNGHGYSYPK